MYKIEASMKIFRDSKTIMQSKVHLFVYSCTCACSRLGIDDFIIVSGVLLKLLYQEAWKIRV